jgi:hypothetical protein
MFRKQDFKKVDLLGSGKKNTKIYKVLHLQSGKHYALKEVEAKTLDKLNEYKVSPLKLVSSVFFRKKPYSCLKLRIIPTSSSFMDTSSTKLCTTLSELVSYANT